MTWAKLDCGYHEQGWVEAATASHRVRRGDLLAAWTVALCWTVQHETDGRIPRSRALRMVAAAVGTSSRKAEVIIAAMVASGTWTEDADGYAFARWGQPRLDERERARGLAAARQSHRRATSDASETRQSATSVATETRQRRDSVATEARHSGDRGATVLHVGPSDSAQLGPMSRRDTLSVSRSRSDQIREDQIRSEQKHAPKERVLPAPAREASPTSPPAPKADTPPTASRVGGTERLSEDTRKILAELSRHPKLAPIASPELAGVIDGRRIGSGTSIADVARAIGDAVAHADEGIAAAPLRRMVVGYCDHARHRGRPKVAPAQSEVPIERAWYPNQGTIEGWAKQPVTQAELDHIDKVFGPGPWDSDKAGVKAGAA